MSDTKSMRDRISISIMEGSERPSIFINYRPHASYFETLFSTVPTVHTLCKRTEAFRKVASCKVTFNRLCVCALHSSFVS